MGNPETRQDQINKAANRYLNEVFSASINHANAQINQFDKKRLNHVGPDLNEYVINTAKSNMLSFAAHSTSLNARDLRGIDFFTPQEKQHIVATANNYVQGDAMNRAQHHLNEYNHSLLKTVPSDQLQKATDHIKSKMESKNHWMAEFVIGMNNDLAGNYEKAVAKEKEKVIAEENVLKALERLKAGEPKVAAPTKPADEYTAVPRRAGEAEQVPNSLPAESFKVPALPILPMSDSKIIAEPYGDPFLQSAAPPIISPKPLPLPRSALEKLPADKFTPLTRPAPEIDPSKLARIPGFALDDETGEPFGNFNEMSEENRAAYLKAYMLYEESIRPQKPATKRDSLDPEIFRYGEELNEAPTLKKRDHGKEGPVAEFPVYQSDIQQAGGEKPSSPMKNNTGPSR